MKKVRVQDAVGMTLCHDMTAILENGFKGVRFARGHVIAPEDIPALLDIGKSHIFVWEPGADEVHEDDAARELTKVLCGEGTAYTGPSEGKMTVTAKTDGLFCVNSNALRTVNSQPDYTVACLPGNTPVKAGEKLAGARIVPLVTSRDVVNEAVAIAREGWPIFCVRPFQKLKTGIVITGSEVYDGRIPDAFEPILRQKLAVYDAQILGLTKCPDDLNAILAAVDGYLRQGTELILLTGGMSVDPDDVTPSAIRARATRFVTQGVPMQPGNMLTIAYHDTCCLIGVPGASMHSPVTSLEVFLPRVFARVEITGDEIAAFGEGGLCRGCTVCHYPNCTFGRR